MAYRVFEVRRRDADRLNAVLHRDPISRQSVTVRDARLLGLKRATIFVHIEGDAGVLDDAADLILRFGRRTPYAEAIHKRLGKEGDAAAGGLGFVFGDG